MERGSCTHSISTLLLDVLSRVVAIIVVVVVAHSTPAAVVGSSILGRRVATGRLGDTRFEYPPDKVYPDSQRCRQEGTDAYWCR